MHPRCGSNRRSGPREIAAISNQSDTDSLTGLLLNQPLPDVTELIAITEPTSETADSESLNVHNHWGQHKLQAEGPRAAVRYPGI